MKLDKQVMEDVACLCRSYLGSYKLAGGEVRATKALKKLNTLMGEIFQESSPGDPPPLGISVSETINTEDKGPGQR